MPPGRAQSIGAEPPGDGADPFGQTAAGGVESGGASPQAQQGFLGDLVGQVFALVVLTVAAAEAAIGLAILVVFYRNRGSIAVEDINLMKG